MLAVALVALSWGDPSVLPDEPAAIDTPAPSQQAVRFRRWGFFVGPATLVLPRAPLALVGGRVDAWAQQWWRHFYLAGGPSIELLARRGQRSVKIETWSLATADIAIGGGQRDRYVVFGHARLGAGIVTWWGDGDHESGLRPHFVFGVGTKFHLRPWLSLGVQLDYVFATNVAAFTSVGFHLRTRCSSRR